MSKLVEMNEKIAENVVDGYKKIEEGVVGGYKKIEEGVVEGFSKVTDKFVENFFTKEDETVEEAKARMSAATASKNVEIKSQNSIVEENLKKAEEAAADARRKAGLE